MDSPQISIPSLAAGQGYSVSSHHTGTQDYLRHSKV